MIPAAYQHARDSGVYLNGVDTSFPGERTPIDPRSIGKAAVLLIIGQSNGGNHGDIRSRAKGPVYNFNLFDGLFYPAQDPLLGATGEGGSPWCMLGDALVADGFAPAVLLVPLCVGGATVADWAPPGPYNHRMSYCLGRLRDSGFWPTHVLWHQGEADALYRTSAEQYRRTFLAMAESLRALGVDAPLYAAVASYFAVPEGYGDSQRAIAEAQRSLVDRASGIFPGPDTNLIGERHDGCHIGGQGLVRHAEAWRSILTASRFGPSPRPV